MSGWSADELARLASDELHISGRRADGTLRKPVIIWMVTLDGELYVRSVNGADAAWFRGTQLTGSGHVNVGTVDRDVHFERTNGIDDELDTAYRAKYPRWPTAVDRITSVTARSTTLRVTPAESR